MDTFTALRDKFTPVCVCVYKDSEIYLHCNFFLHIYAICVSDDITKGRTRDGKKNLITIFWSSL